MKIGIISDSHDRLDHLEKVVQLLRDQSISIVLHLGDFCAPFVLAWMAEQTDITWYGVWGNNDGDKLAGYKLTANSKVDIASGDFRELLLHERQLFLTHYPEIGRIAALSGKYDVVLHGHTHVQASEVVVSASGEETLLANPGEIYGMRTGTVGYANLDLETLHFQLQQI